MRRPDVAWKKIPEVVRAGERFAAEIELSGAEGTAIDGLVVALIGTQTWADGSTRSLAGCVRRLESAMRLPAHKSYRVELEVPASALPSGFPPEDAVLEERDRSTVEWFVVVRASIPWWPDLEEPRRLVVVAARQHASSRAAPVPVFRRFGSGDERAVEISLDDSAYSADDVVRGAVAIDALDDPRTYGLEIDIFTVRHVRHVDFEEDGIYPLARLLHRKGIDHGGEAVPFSGSVPDGTPAGHESWVQIRWESEGLAQHWRVPVSLVAAAPRADRTTPPSVGRDRWRALWLAVAEAHALDVDADGAMRGTRSERAFEITLDDRLRARVRGSRVTNPDDPRLRAALEAFAEHTWLADDVVVACNARHAHDDEGLEIFVRDVEGLCGALAASSACGPYR